jgi:hypothetical protein
MRRYILAALVGLAAPGALNAQQVQAGRFSFEPYAGAFRDPYDIGNDDKDVGFFGGARASYDLGIRTRVIANLAYAETEDVAFSSNASNRRIWNNRWIHTTAGLEFDLIPGATRLAAGLQGGVAWRNNSIARELGTPLPDGYFPSNEWASYGVVVPSLSLQHQLGNRVALALRAADYLFPDEGGLVHSPAVTFGLDLR